MRTMVEMAASQVFDIGLPPRLRMLPARGRGDGWREPSRMGFRVSIRYSGIVKVELLHHASEGELPTLHASARVHLENGGSVSPPVRRRDQLIKALTHRRVTKSAAR